MTAQNVAVVRSVYDNFVRGDIPAVLAALAPEIEWVESTQSYLPHRGTHRSPAQVADKVFGMVVANFDEFSVVAERRRRGGRGRGKFRRAGPAGDQPPGEVTDPELMLIPYTLLALGLIGSLLLFLTLKREIRTSARRHRQRIDDMSERLREAERRSETMIWAAPPPAARSGMNLNKRVHALRMLRRGEDISHVAAALAVPRKEVELLIRVQEMTRKRVAAIEAG